MKTIPELREVLATTWWWQKNVAEDAKYREIRAGVGSLNKLAFVQLCATAQPETLTVYVLSGGSTALLEHELVEKVQIIGGQGFVGARFERENGKEHMLTEPGDTLELIPGKCLLRALGTVVIAAYCRVHNVREQRALAQQR